MGQLEWLLLLIKTDSDTVEGDDDYRCVFTTGRCEDVGEDHVVGLSQGEVDGLGIVG